MGEKKRGRRRHLQLSVTLPAEKVREIRRISKILGIPQSKIVEFGLKHGEKGLKALKEAARMFEEASKEKK